MKKITFLFFVLMTLHFSFLHAQVPQKMSYQAVIRDANNNLLVNSPVGLRFSILQGSATGTAVYVETHRPTTNVNGLTSVDIGSGTVVSGTFSTINWSSGIYFLQTETDPSGGTNYSIQGTSQLLTVPYAFVADRVLNPAGNNGFNTLVKTTNLTAAQSSCRSGGVRLQFGLDANRNNILDNAEIISSLTKTICNGTIGAQGPSGNGISSTVDNGNGTFTFFYTDGSSFTTSNLIGMTGPAGPTGPVGPSGPAGPVGPSGIGFNSLVASTVEFAGPNCLNGGIRLDYGIDSNSNQILDAFEINPNATTYVCNGLQGPAGANGSGTTINCSTSFNNNYTVRGIGNGDYECTNAIWVTSTDVVGIGTTSPNSSFDLTVGSGGLLVDGLSTVSNIYGKLRIGSTSTTSYELQVDGDTYMNGGLRVGTTSAPATGGIRTNGDIQTASRFIQGSTTSGTGTVMVRTSTGELRPQSSTIKVKENIQPLDVDKNKVFGLRPVNYDLKAGIGGGHESGLIAEEVEKVLPELVIYGPARKWKGDTGLVETDENGKEILIEGKKEPYSVHYDRLAVYLLEIVKEQEKRISELEEIIKKQDAKRR